MSAIPVKVGYAAKLYYGDAETASVTGMTEVPIIREATINHGRKLAEEQTRQSAYPRRASTGADISIDFQLSWQPSNATFQALETAFLAGTPIALAALSEDKATAGARGPLGDFILESWNRSEPIDGALVVDVTAQLSNYTDYVEISES